ncbi:MAG: acetolactate decarboxylase [Acidobacteriaceae bacterium]|nr:acetolactate decarboxylase [Acidobacteriaceae bacterium]
MQQLNCVVRDGLWDLLQRRSNETDEPVSHIINRALADYLGFDAHTIYQVSTSTALVEGIYQGAVRVGTLREHGDLGLGTFENLDGEMVVLGGEVYQVRGDGSVREVGDDVLSPFAVVTSFSPDTPIELGPCPNYESLLAQLDRLRDSENMFYSIRIDGHFDAMQTRAVCKAEKGFRLINAAAVQPEFRFSDVSGTLVGFWTPSYARTLSIPGYHLHFLSQDRTKGGHVLGCGGSGLRLQLQRDCNVQIALPETEDFLNGDLRRDPGADLAKAEGVKK